MAVDLQIPPVPPNTPVTDISGASSPDLVDSMSLADLQIASPARNIIIIGISGPPSSGKNVLTSLLAGIFGATDLKDELASEFCKSNYFSHRIRVLALLPTTIPTNSI